MDIIRTISKTSNLNAITKQIFDLEFSLICVCRKNKSSLCLLGNDANSSTGEQILSLFSLEMEKDELFFMSYFQAKPGMCSFLLCVIVILDQES